MATTRLSDVIVPEVYQSYGAENSPEKTVFVESGVVTADTFLDQIANEGGDTVNIPFWKDLDSTVEPNLSSDDPAQTATPNKITTGKQTARKAYLNQWYSSADLTGEMAGSSPMQRIRNRFGEYWARQFQRRIIASTNGILADNVANDNGDMVVAVAAEAVASQTIDTGFNRDVFTEAVFTMGDMADSLSAIGIHSRVLAQMVKNDDIVYIPDSEGRLNVPTYMGLRVIVDDNMTVTAGTTDGFKYTSVLFGTSAFGFGVGSPDVPIEVERKGMEGNGGGVEYLGERSTWLVHPFGFQSTGTPAALSFSTSELATAGVWDRVVDRKNVPLAFLITN